MINSKKLLRFQGTTRGEINWLIGPPWRVRANGESRWYSKKNVVWQHMRLVKQELLFGICECLSDLDQVGVLAMPVDVSK